MKYKSLLAFGAILPLMALIYSPLTTTTGPAGATTTPALVATFGSNTLTCQTGVGGTTYTNCSTAPGTLSGNVVFITTKKVTLTITSAPQCVVTITFTKTIAWDGATHTYTVTAVTPAAPNCAGMGVGAGVQAKRRTAKGKVEVTFTDAGTVLTVICNKTNLLGTITGCPVTVGGVKPATVTGTISSFTGTPKSVQHPKITIVNKLTGTFCSITLTKTVTLTQVGGMKTTYTATYSFTTAGKGYKVAGTAAGCAKATIPQKTLTTPMQPPPRPNMKFKISGVA